ncbi:MAG TPA: SulP family inorganic anion transporter [Polyangiaceae bacterium]|nr:SulP family inorganic anion transporter [Polyangiaceae bacterium]
MRLVAGARNFKSYERAWLVRDVVAGLVLTAFLVPVGMGYAQAAGLPPITGLYATVLPLLAYALFGPSRVLVLGPDSSLAALIAAIVAPLAAGDAERAVALAGGLAILTGVVIAGTGILKLGFVTELLSRPMQLGYLAGVAVLILIGQTPKLCGFDVEAESVLQQVVAIARALPTANRYSVALGLGAIAIIVVQRRFAPRLPGALVAVVAGIAAVRLFELDARGVHVLGQLPRGFPALAIPHVSLGDVPNLIAGALGIALVSVADTSVLSQSLASERAEEIDPDEELFALGAANIASGLFGGFPVSGSTSRTPVAVAAGSRSQLTGIVGAVAIVGLFMLAPGLLDGLPQPVLAGIVLVAAYGLVDQRRLVDLFHRRWSEFGLFTVAFVGVTFLGVLNGILIAIVLSLGDFVRRAWRPHDAVLGWVEAVGGYHDVSRYPHAERAPGLVVYRFDAPLFFANARYFQSRVRELAGAGAEQAKWVVVAAEPMTDVDTTAAEILESLQAELAQRGITFAFAELKDPVKDRLRRYGLVPKIGETRFFHDVGGAAEAYFQATRSAGEDHEP